MKTAIVLAGGLGTRLRSEVPGLPKPMASVSGIPFLEYVLNFLEKNGIQCVVLSVGYKWEMIYDYFGQNFKEMELQYSVEKSPLGTGGAIKKALAYVTSDDVYIINGDTFFDVDLSKLSLAGDSKLLLCLKHMQNFDRYGCVEFNRENKVDAFCDKRFRQKGTINGGVYLAKSHIFKGFKLNEKFSFEGFMKENFKVLEASACCFDSYFIDIGIPEDYRRAQHEMHDFL